jgi:predicted AAA+ superfamily ATPase
MGSTLLLDGATPRLIDEWQVVGDVWALVKDEADARGQQGLRGQFILTGSSTPEDGATRSTGAGRVTRLKMRPLSLFESGHSTGEVSLESLFQEAKPSAKDPGTDLQAVVERICIGGWPLYAKEPLEIARIAMQSYIEEISRMDIREASGVKHDPIKVARVIKSLARNIGTKCPVSTISADASPGNSDMDPKNVARYLDALSRLMIVEDLPSWGPHIRSKALLRDAETRYFVDPCLAVAASQTSPGALLSDLEATGLLFENLVVRDLRIYTQNFNGRMSQYRDSYDTEVDVIIQAFDEKWAAIEVKLGVNQVDEAATKLLRFAQNVDTSRSSAPTFLAVITGTGFAYVRKDGVFVIPIGVLGP